MKDHKKLEKWWKKNKKRIFQLIWIVFAAVVLLVGVSVLSSWLGEKLRSGFEEFIGRQFIDRITPEDGQEIGVRIHPSEKDFKEAGLVSASFTDLFSGVGWLDQSKTTAYHDRVVTAFTFPPRFEWRRISELNVPESEIMRVGIRRADGSDLRCIGGECLVQKNEKLYFVLDNFLSSYDNPKYRVMLPEEERGRNIVNVSIGSLKTKWLVGVVEQRAGEYIGRVYLFENGEFESLFSDGAAFRSRYQGRIGFGGDDNNFLVIYGAYEGQAYHIRDGEERKDISRFFGIRVMDGGFEPVVIKRGDGENTTWYVGSNTGGTPKLLKLFQNGTNEIAGAVDLSNSLFPSGVERATFYPFVGTECLRAEVEDVEGKTQFWEFVDQGFEKTEEKEVASVNLNNYPAEVRYASIGRMEFSEEGADVSFYVSNNGEDWIELSEGEEIQFPDKEGRRLLWKVEFDPDRDLEKSPFLDTFQLKYLVKFL